MHLDRQSKYVEIHLFDRVSWEDFHCIAPRLEAFVLDCGKVRMLEVIDRFEGLDADMLWDGLRLDRKIMPHISHCALVGDADWLGPLERAREAVLPMQLRLFSLREESAARAWLTRACLARTYVVAHRAKPPAQGGNASEVQIPQTVFGTRQWG
jgi:hypothetical protein